MRNPARLAILAALVAALVVPALAGDAKKCTASTQDCLDHMTAALKARGWLGVEGEDSDGYFKIKKVVSGSPAETAGIMPGDVLVAVNGTDLAKSEEATLKVMQKALTPGSKVEYSILRGGARTSVTATLASMPEEVMARIIGEHLIADHATVALAKN